MQFLVTFIFLNFSSIYAKLCNALTFGLVGLLDLSKSLEEFLMWSDGHQSTAVL
jgi:hypothetical protein